MLGPLEIDHLGHCDDGLDQRGFTVLQRLADGTVAGQVPQGIDAVLKQCHHLGLYLARRLRAADLFVTVDHQYPLDVTDDALEHALGDSAPNGGAEVSLDGTVPAGVGLSLWRFHTLCPFHKGL
jgi:hypothetical protein